jgi:hypothetical protein
MGIVSLSGYSAQVPDCKRVWGVSGSDKTKHTTPVNLFIDLELGSGDWRRRNSLEIPVDISCVSPVLNPSLGSYHEGERVAPFHDGSSTSARRRQRQHMGEDRGLTTDEDIEVAAMLETGQR